MKILLISPPQKNEIGGSFPFVVTQERGFNPPLGLLYIAGYIERYTDHAISVIDSQVDGLDQDSLAMKIREIAPDVVGITTITMALVDVVKTIGTVKNVDKNIRIVLGGPHVHLFPDETINLNGVDYLVLGEGEEVFKELLEKLDDKPKLKEMPGLVFKYNGEIVNTGMSRPIENIDTLPFPARHLTPYKKYSSILAKRSPVSTIFTSRGCPFNCIFCDRRHMGKVFRSRSPKNVVDELEECIKMGIYDFLFYDDTFTVGKERAINICKEIVKRKLDIRWDIRTRVDTVDEELIRHLKEAGCQGVHYGVEAGTEKILKILNKHISIGQVKEVFGLTRRYKISILAYFMIGNPTETMEDIYATFRVMKMLDPDYAHISILSPFPGTKIYLDGLSRGIIKRDYWREFSSDPAPDFVMPYWEEVFNRDELVVLLKKGYKAFYLRTSYVFKSIKNLKTFEEFRKKVTAGFKILIMR